MEAGLIVDNSSLKDCVFSMNTSSAIMNAISKNPMELIGSLGDQSWSVLGKEKQAQREQKMQQAASALQAGWKNRKHVQQGQKMESPANTMKNVPKKTWQINSDQSK